MKKGFTLIELLVVVLIIGILAAVALPQYQVAVEKSRLATVMATVRALKDGQEMLYLANGAYEQDGESLTGLLPAGCTYRTAGQVDCDNIKYDIGFLGSPDMWDVGGFTQINGYVMHYDHSAASGQTECMAETGNKTAERVCKSMGGTKIGTFSGTAFIKAMDRYRLP